MESDVVLYMIQIDICLTLSWNLRIMTTATFSTYEATGDWLVTYNSLQRVAHKLSIKPKNNQFTRKV